LETNVGHIWRTFALLARRIPRRTSRPPHSRAGTSGTSSKAEFSNVTIHCAWSETATRGRLHWQ